MTFRKSRVFAGTVATLIACLGAIQSASARPLLGHDQNDEQLFSQVNQPQREAVPRLNTTEVRGQIMAIDGDVVQIRTVDNELVSYTISEDTQQDYDMAVGEDIVLLVREDEVIGINPAVAPEPGTATTTGATEVEEPEYDVTTETTVETPETITRQDTTVQQPQYQQQPAPTTAQPAPTTAQPAPQPVRALW